MMETGKCLPSVPEICTLSLIYGRSFESLFGPVFLEARTDLKARLAALPNRSQGWLGQFNRQNTINKIAKRLEDNHPYRG